MILSSSDQLGVIYNPMSIKYMSEPTPSCSGHTLSQSSRSTLYHQQDMASINEIDEDHLSKDVTKIEKAPEYKVDQLAFTTSIDEGYTDEFDLKARNIGFDPNAPSPDDKIDTAGDQYAVETGLEDSPYPEVRAAVPNTDDYEMPVNTVRMWVLGLASATVGSSLNMFFSMHSPTYANLYRCFLRYF